MANEIVFWVLGLSAGFFGGLSVGYRIAGRAYHDCAKLLNRSAAIADLREELFGAPEGHIASEQSA